MKKLNGLFFLLFTISITVVGQVHAQQKQPIKSDKITFLDGKERVGTVTAMAGGQLQFIHKGETLSYEFKVNEIERIDYASGRSEVLNYKHTQEAPTVNSKNNVAVLPMVYVGEGSESRSSEMRFLLQEIAINYMSKSAFELKFRDAAEINALLLKSGINEANIKQYTPKELAALLRVEYVIMGSVVQGIDNIRTVTNNHNDRKRTTTQQYDKNIITRDRNNRSSSTHTEVDMDTEVFLSIYNNTGEKIYGQSRRSMLSEQDAYKATIHYMLKRTSLYKR